MSHRIETHHIRIYGVTHERFAVVDRFGSVVFETTDYKLAKVTAAKLDGRPGWSHWATMLYLGLIAIAIIMGWIVR